MLCGRREDVDARTALRLLCHCGTKVHRHRFYSDWKSEGLKRPLRKLWPEQVPESWDDLVTKMNALTQLPAWTNAWTMPIKARIDMLTTGVRTPVGVKVFGSNLEQIFLSVTAPEP